MKKKIKQYIFVDDALGEGDYAIPVITLQHPLKHAQDAYLFSKEVHREARLLRICDGFTEEVYVTGEIEYSQEGIRRVITKLKITKIELDLE